MNKLLLLGLCFSACVYQLHAQSGHPAAKLPPVKTVAEPAPLRAKAPAASAARVQGASYGARIGKTFYDLQSNGASGNRIVRHADGTLSVTWTESCGPGATTWPTRGAGYNYYNGTTWIHGADATCDESGAAYGIFTARVGWPEMITFSSGREMVIAHTGSGLAAVTRAQKGTGGMNSWVQSNLNIPAPAEGNTWPKAVASGSTVHLIASSSTTVGGLNSGLAYYRSTNEGVTWTQVALPGMNGTSFNEIGGDNYAIHANGNNVAIVAGDFENDWVMWKSTNGGTSWTKKVIRHFTPADIQVSTAGDSTYLTNDSYHAVLVDNNGTVHCWAGAFIIGPSPDPTSNNGWDTNTIFPQTEGLWYWNSGGLASQQPVLLVDEREDIYPAGDPYNWIGNGTYVTPRLINSYQGSQTGMPSAALAPNGDIYLVYSGIVEGTSNTGDSTGQSFRDLYVMKGTNGGMAWSAPKNIADDIAGVGRTDFEEDVFPSVAHTIGADNQLHLIWQSDVEPGLAVRIDEDVETENSIMHFAFNVTQQSWPVVTILGPALANDVGVVSITAPASGCGLSSTSQVCIRVQNFGTAAQSNIPVTYTLNGGTPRTGTIAGPLAAGAATTYCFTATANLSTPGTYTIVATSNLSGDAAAANNSTSTTISSSAAPAVTFSGLAASYCQNAPAATLSGSPSGGTFNGPGISGSSFNPAIAGAGTFTLTYAYTNAAGCTGIQSRAVTVKPAPNASFTGLSNSYCSTASAVSLSGSPTGGTFSGPGVNGTTFNPATAGVGTHSVSYTVTGSNGCSAVSVRQVTVTSQPAISIVGIGNRFCINSGSANLTGSPSGGTFSGPGVSGSSFNPATAGLGTHTITYNYASSSGCSGQATTAVTVNTLPSVSMSGLAASYCTNAGAVSLVGTPSGGTFTGPGTSGSTFTPSSAGTGSHAVTYNYTDPSTNCSNTSTQSTVVSLSPVAIFSTSNAGTAFSFTSSSVGAVSYAWDFGDGATSTQQNPSHTYATVGNYTVTLTVTGAGGCSGSQSQNISASIMGLQENQGSQQLIVYPNPTAAGVYLKLAGNGQIERVEVYTLLGQQVKAAGELKTNQLHFDLQELATGTYLVRVVSGSHTYYRKVMVQK